MDTYVTKPITVTKPAILCPAQQDCGIAGEALKDDNTDIKIRPEDAKISKATRSPESVSMVAGLLAKIS